MSGWESRIRSGLRGFVNRFRDHRGALMTFGNRIAPFQDVEIAFGRRFEHLPGFLDSSFT